MLYSFSADYMKDVSKKNMNSTKSQNQKKSFEIQLDAKKATMRKSKLNFLAGTDAEYILGAGQDEQTLGSEKVLELVESYLYNTPEGFEELGKEFMVKDMAFALDTIS
jgi:hypothetical protein